MLENADTATIFWGAVVLISGAGTLALGFVNRKVDGVDAKADSIMKLHDAHVLYVSDNYAKVPAMNEGFKEATKTAKEVAAALDIKLDKTQTAVQGIALEQAKQGENIKSMGDSIKNIALSIEKKSS